jgi:hypothetical protein
MADNKTKPTKVSVTGFLEKQARPEQLADCQELVKIFKALTGKAPKMWGPSIVGFGSYHYVYPSGRGVTRRCLDSRRAAGNWRSTCSVARSRSRS